MISIRQIIKKALKSIFKATQLTQMTPRISVWIRKLQHLVYLQNKQLKTL